MFEILRNAPKVKSFFNKVEGYVILTKRDSGDFKKFFRTAVRTILNDYFSLIKWPGL